MASRVKEDEKNERIIRALLKQPGNRKCINCNVLGPQYVCITFSTFVCTTCGGIHREFTHRVKSVSMAKFSAQEIASLQAGGNERAREIFFKDWDSQNLKAPDSSNVDKLRTFIKHVYVDRRYTGESSIDRPSQGDKVEPNENRRSESYRSESRSPPYDDERRYSDRPSPGHDVRSPDYGQDNRRHSDYGRSPVRSGIVSDWRREDRFSNGRRSDDRRSSDGEFKSEMRSPDSQNDSSISSPPVVRPVRDILGDNVIPLRISEPPRANSVKVAEGAVITQRTASSSSLASSNGNPTELKRETSLIDFDASSKPVAATQVQQSVVDQSVPQATNTPSDDNWACFDNVVEKVEKDVSQKTPPNSSSLESALFDLFAPASGGDAPKSSNDMFPASSSGNFINDSVSNTSATAPSGAFVTSSLTTLTSSSGGVAPGHGLAPTMPTNGGVQWHGTQIPQPPSTVAVNQPAASQLVSGYAGNLSYQGVTGNPVPQAPHSFTQAPQVVPTPAAQAKEAEASRRQALPADLFTATYSPIPYQGPGWQTGMHPGMHPGMRFPMQYNTAMSMPSFPQPIRSANPFDVNAEASPSQAAAFPSMSSMHTALPNMGAPGGQRGSRPSWMPTQLSSYPSTIPPNGPSFAPPMPGAYMGQQLHSNMPPSRPQGFGSFGTTPNPSVGGNPFG
ncbi:uncharacterized protein LOC141605951 [Silene latifolia]|uniref:uncharacterized protein LOC141605951 n=1 Tax=Silene latifolia TaxID=37657 RepID=UPI003D77BFFA